ncbi:hypothetical protein [Nesterenkonia ebinurensis]|uniref:hypothetical protein n=1 Tax=Nesterenkonia ebinurensis TaxID=2608252 RepID=UPI00123E37D6|nr:hypothetical protein [Nesterenkonia ebinurensis]
MSAETENKQQRQLLSEAAKEPPPKPPLGPPHDAWATVLLTLTAASFLFFAGYTRAEWNTVGWTGFILSAVASIGTVQYFIRAYGFKSRRWQEDVPTGGFFAFFIAFGATTMFITEAIYRQLVEESLFALVIGFLGLATMLVVPVRMALGHAPKPPTERIAEG